jgi:hypothetical protein
MDSSPGGGAPMDDWTISEVAAELLLSVLRSASTEKIQPVKWWTTAKTALETAAGTSRSWPEFVSRLAKKLQVDALSGDSSRSACDIGLRVGIDGFARFRRVAKRDAIMITALAQAMRDEQRAAKVASGEWAEWPRGDQ